MLLGKKSKKGKGMKAGPLKGMNFKTSNMTKKARKLLAVKRNRYIAIGIVAIIIIAAAAIASIPTGAAMDCDYVSTGWLDMFSEQYFIVPDDAVQCDSDHGSVVIARFRSSADAKDAEAALRGALMEMGHAEQLDYFSEICSSSRALCVKDMCIKGSSTNGIVSLGGGSVAIINANSRSSGAISSLLDSLSASRGSIASMLA